MYLILWILVSVHTTISCLVFTAARIIDPEDSFLPPARFSNFGLQTDASSDSDHRISRGSITLDPIGVVPKQIA